MGPIGAGLPEDAGAASGRVICAGGGVEGAVFVELGGTDGGGLQPVCSESQSLERPPQLTVAAASAATTSASALPSGG